MNSSFWKFRLLNIIGFTGIGMALLIPSSGAISPNVQRSSTTNVLEVAQCTGRGGRTVSPRGPLDPLIPYVVNPRDTAVLRERPNLQWNAVPGGNRYTVSLLNGETVIWTKEVQNSKIEYPTDALPLQPGIDYTLKVQASNGHSSTEDDWQLQSFHLLLETDTAAVRQAEALMQSQPNNDQMALLKANLYAGSGLRGEAIATLEAKLATGSQSSTLYRQLADLYTQEGLFILAEAKYLKAIELVSSNLEERAIVQAALGDLYGAIGDVHETILWLKEAEKSYRKLNNQLKVKELQEQIQLLVP